MPQQIGKTDTRRKVFDRMPCFGNAIPARRCLRMGRSCKIRPFFWRNITNLRLFCTNGKKIPLRHYLLRRKGCILFINQPLADFRRMQAFAAPVGTRPLAGEPRPSQHRNSANGKCSARCTENRKRRGQIRGAFPRKTQLRRQNALKMVSARCQSMQIHTLIV